MKHVIVVGSGIAGLIAALEISRVCNVTLVTKARLSESNTRYAQGGIAAAMFHDDSAAEHISDTLRAGAGLCNREAVEVLCNEGPARVRDLIALGVDFDLHEGELARGLEAAHTRARVLHAGGDATGLTIETALVRAVRGTANLRIREYTFACDVVLQEGTAIGLNVQHGDEQPERLFADAVVLASGGAGQLFRYTTNPPVATGDGVAIALRAGAQLADVEFYQFHPTLLAAAGPPFLISEAVRGEGALLLDAQGRRFMPGLHAGAELAPRDVVARGIAAQMLAQPGQPVRLDATALGAHFLGKRFPTISAACHDRGLDWATDPIPITPAAHYWMGGVQTDIVGRTSVPGLFAVGEVACTGVHGANRLASNSLLESLVFAWRCAQHLLSHDPESDGARRPADFDSPQRLEIGADRNADVVDRAALQTLMWEHAGIRRSAAGLRHAAAQLRAWRGDGTGVFQRETANLLALARVVVAAALAREESRGAHHREDFPETSDALAHSLAYTDQAAAQPATELAECS